MKAILRYLFNMDFVSKLFIMLGAILLVPFLMLIPYPEDIVHGEYFLWPALFSIAFGLLFRSKKPDPDKFPFFGRSHESVVVVGIWIYGFILGAMPYFLSGQLTFVESLFESVSGWTTTGLTVLEVEGVSRIFHFYRAFTQFCGGLGFILLMLIFSGGSSAMQLFSAEGHPDKLEPNLRSTAKTMILIYVGSNILGTAAYMLAGMDWFESAIHSMAALATGGFGIFSANIAAYESPAIEFISIILMLIGATNFAILALLVKRKFRKVRRIGELRFFAAAIIISTGILIASGLYRLFGTFEESIRAALFQIVSAITGTGFSTMDLSRLEGGMILIMVFVMVMGGASGSTAGGIKYTRGYAMYKSLLYGIKRKFMPERAVNEEAIYNAEGKQYLSPRYMEEVGRFIIAYILIFLTGSLLLTFSGMSMEVAMFEFASAFGTVGLTMGPSGPGTGDYVLWVEIVGMMLGRLEIFIVFTSIVALIQRVATKIKGTTRSLYS